MSASPSDARRASERARPLVTVVTAAYNVAQYLEASARSALAQTYRNLELVIVDDGSTDATAEVARRVACSEPARVRVIRQANKGIAAARNTGLHAARGDYLALLDSDDLWEPRFLEHQMETLLTTPVDLVSGNGRYLGGALHGMPVRPCPDPRPPIDLATIIADEEAVFVMTVFHRRVLETIGGFDESLRTNEDFDYWLRAALAGLRFARNAEPLGWYRRRDDSLSADAPRMLRGALRVCDKARALVGERPERALLERQIAYYEAELDAALARQALAEGDMARAADALRSLHLRRPGLRTAFAVLMARHAAPVLRALYRLKQHRLSTHRRRNAPIANRHRTEVAA